MNASPTCDPRVAQRVESNLVLETVEATRESQVLAALPGTPADIGAATGHDWMVVMAALHALGERGCVRRCPGGRYERTER